MHGAQQNYIGGTWVAAVVAAPNVNPSNLNDVIADYARAQPAEVDTAVAAATAAFASYSCSTPQERFEALKKISDEILARKDELGRLLSREEGKTLPEGIGEVVRDGQIFAFFAGEAVRISGEKIASTRPGIDVEITREPETRCPLTTTQFLCDVTHTLHLPIVLDLPGGHSAAESYALTT